MLNARLLLTERTLTWVIIFHFDRVNVIIVNARALVKLTNEISAHVVEVRLLYEMLGLYPSTVLVPFRMQISRHIFMFSLSV